MKNTTVRSVFVALFAALICIGAFLKIPAGPFGVPIVLQNMLCILAGCILGNIQGAAAVGLFIIAGGIGLPVYSGGASGFATLMKSTGGFFYGYFLGALIAGLIVGRPKVTEKKVTIRNVIKISLAALAGFVIVYLPAIPWALFVTKKDFATIIAGYVLPFIPGDLIKMVVTIILSVTLRPVAARYLSN